MKLKFAYWRKYSWLWKVFDCCHIVGTTLYASNIVWTDFRYYLKNLWLRSYYILCNELNTCFYHLFAPCSLLVCFCTFKKSNYILVLLYKLNYFSIIVVETGGRRLIFRKHCRSTKLQMKMCWWYGGRRKKLKKMYCLTLFTVLFSIIVKNNTPVILL